MPPQFETHLCGRKIGFGIQISGDVNSKNMATVPWGWRAVRTVWKQGPKWNVVKTTCFWHFSFGMRWLERLKVVEGLPRTKECDFGQPSQHFTPFFESRLRVGHVSIFEFGTKCSQAFPPGSFGPGSPRYMRSQVRSIRTSSKIHEVSSELNQEHLPRYMKSQVSSIKNVFQDTWGLNCVASRRSSKIHEVSTA